MVWYYKQVETLREKYINSEQDITKSEIQNLQKYVDRKKLFLEKPGTIKEQFYKAENLLKQLKGAE